MTMHSLRIIALVFFSALLFNGCGTPASTPTKAQSNDQRQKAAKPGVRQVQPLSANISKELQQVVAIVQPDYSKTGYFEPHYNVALKKLNKLGKFCQKKCTPYERATVFRITGYTYFQADNKESALKYYSKVVEQSPGIPLAIELDALSTAASLALDLGNNKLAKRFANRFSSLSKLETDKILYIKGKLKFDEGDYNSALVLTGMAVQKSESRGAGALAPEEWYRLLLQLYTTTGKVNGMREIRKKLQKVKAIKNEFLPIVKPEPEYPIVALQKKIQGTCTVEFTVSKLGKTKDIRVLQCSHPIFQLNSMTAASRFIYKPKYKKGAPVEVTGVRHRFTFNLKK